MKPRHFCSPSNRRRGFMLVDIILLIACLLVLSVFWFEHFRPHRKKAVRVNCVNNVRQVALAYRIWAGDNGDLYPMEVFTNSAGRPAFTDTNGAWRYFQVMSNELSTPRLLVCPQDFGRRAATNFTTDLDNQKLSYCIGLSARCDTTNLLLAGDRNLVANSARAGNQLSIGVNESIHWTEDIHRFQGNVALTDGSVLSLGPSTPANWFGSNNWLLFP